jgi:hypothetical protein
MTQTASLRRYARYLALGLILLGLGLALAVGQHAQAAPAAVTYHRIDAIPVQHAGGTDVSGTLDRQAALTAAAGAGELSPVQVARMNAAAQRVCEGWTAEVPLIDMDAALVRDEGLTPVQAHDFVLAALHLVCKVY